MSLPVRLIVLLAGLHVLFAAWPQIDLIVASWFHGPGGFALKDADALQLLRDMIWNVSVAVALGALLALALWGWIHARARISARLWGFVVLLYLLGPGLVVDLVFKSYWGRARPADLSIFGGEASFTLPFQIADQCARNCSFVSGEVSGTTVTAIALGVLLWPCLPPRGRQIAVAALTLLVTSGAILRIAMGRHFLSDVVFACVLMALLAAALYRVMGIGRVHRSLTPENLRHDLSVLVDEVRSLGGLLGP